MPDTIALPETVEIPTEELIAVAAELLAWQQVFSSLNGRMQAGLDMSMESLAHRLLVAVAPHPQFTGAGWFDMTHPIAVEAYARGTEAGYLGLFPTPDGAKQDALRIREKRHAQADLYTDKELERERSAR